MGAVCTYRRKHGFRSGYDRQASECWKLGCPCMLQRRCGCGNPPSFTPVSLSPGAAGRSTHRSAVEASDAPQETFDLFDGAEIDAGRYAWNRAELQ